MLPTRIWIRLVKEISTTSKSTGGLFCYSFFLRFISLLHFWLYPKSLEKCNVMSWCELLLHFISPNYLIPLSSVISTILDKVKKNYPVCDKVCVFSCYLISCNQGILLCPFLRQGQIQYHYVHTCTNQWWNV